MRLVTVEGSCLAQCKNTWKIRFRMPGLSVANWRRSPTTPARSAGHGIIAQQHTLKRMLFLRRLRQLQRAKSQTPLRH